MNIDVTFRHMDSTTALKEHAIEKFEHLEHFFDQIQDIHVVLSAEKKHHIAEVTVHSPGEVFKATASMDDMYVAIDTVLSKLERHMRRRKEILKVNSHKGDRTTYELTNESNDDIDDIDDGDLDDFEDAEGSVDAAEA